MSNLPGHEILAALQQTSASALLRARRVADGATVLLRVLQADSAHIATVARFRHEYEVVRRLRSAYVLPALAVEGDGKRLVVVLEDFAGADLATLLREAGPPALPRFLQLAIALAQGLEDIHRGGLVHGDLRPHNILVRVHGDRSAPDLKLVGFGVEAELTHEHAALYSPAVLADVLPYISPEKTGRMNRTVDAGTDLYSLGVVLFELLAGRPPFRASDPVELLHAHIAALPPSLVDVAPGTPPAIAEIVAKLLRKNTEDRYHGAASLKADLLECQRRVASVTADGAPGDIGALTIGAGDSGQLFKLHQKLYGRQQDIDRLLAAFEDSLRGRPEVVLVSGYSGIGKSSLVQEVLKPLARQRGYYISGKFDQYNRDVPYSAIFQACEGLVRQLLAESEARIGHWRAAIVGALGNNGQVVCEVLPSLTRVLGPQPPVPALGPVEAQNRFSLYFTRFIAVFARAAHPLVLFLDDLQWIDAASLGLLRSMLLSGSLESLLFCGAYRDNEVGPAHPLLSARAELQAGGLAVRDIVLAPLDLQHLIELIGDSIGNHRCTALAGVVLRKTGGNPFFIKQFMRALHEQGLLVYVPGRGWQWDLHRVESLEVTDNVADLMTTAIRRLPPATREALELAAMFGNRFDLELLATVSGCSVDVVYGRLDAALREGLLIDRGEQLQFVHDKVQEAAYSLIAADERPAAHLRIGRLLRDRLGAAERHAAFDIVNHFNAAAALLTDPDERLDVARLNLQVAEKAEESAAFAGALRHLTLGAALLPDDVWDRDYPLAFAYATRTGVMQSLCQQSEASLATLGAASARARGRVDKTHVQRLILDVQQTCNDLLAALEQGREALRLFDIDLPAFPDDAALMAELAATMVAIETHCAARLGPDPATRSDEQVIAALSDLPALGDPEVAALQDLLQGMFAPTAFLGSHAFPITVMKILQNSLRHGGSRNTSYAYVNFGVFLCAAVDRRQGYLFGRAAVQINRAQQDRKSEAMLANMYGPFVQHWCEPYAKVHETLVSGMHAGMETGEYIWAFYDAVNAATVSFLRGAPLPAVLAEARSYQPLYRLDKFGAITWMAQSVGQMAQFLTTPSPEPHRLRGEWVDLEPVMTEARRIHNKGALFFASYYQVLNGVFQGAYLYTARLCDDTDADVVGIAAWQGNSTYRFYGGLAYALAHDDVVEADPDTAARYRGHAAQFARLLDEWAALCPANLHHRALLLRAELRRLDGDIGGAAELYDAGIAAAAAGGFMNDEALGNELCGRFYARLGRRTIACAYISEAQRRYAAWGADQAVSRLERSWAHLLPQAPGPRSVAPREGVHVELDVHAVLAASQALSGEIVLPRLLERLLDIILAHAGARRGVLLLREDEQLRVHIGRDLDTTRPPVQPGVLTETCGDVPVHLVQYVARTEEDVVLADAADDSVFGGDPYMALHTPRSLLAAPIRQQGRLTGVIYLENNLATGAFTPERVEMLRLLSTQAAISIENALLYARLEDKVAERTAELREAHERIVALGREQQRRQEDDLREKQALIVHQAGMIRALGTPIIEVWDGVLTAPLVGTLDDARAVELTESLLQRITAKRSRHAILDLTGVDSVDTTTAMHLVNIVRAVQLLGAVAVITGLSPAAADAMASLDIDLRRLPTRPNLRAALRDCIARADPARS